MPDNFDALPLREKFTNAERLTRELIEHLEQGFLPKVQNLRSVVKKGEDSSVTDITVRNHAGRVLESDRFTQELTEKLASYMQAIGNEMKPMVFGD